MPCRSSEAGGGVCGGGGGRWVDGWAGGREGGWVGGRAQNKPRGTVGIKLPTAVPRSPLTTGNASTLTQAVLDWRARHRPAALRLERVGRLGHLGVGVFNEVGL